MSAMFKRLTYSLSYTLPILVVSGTLFSIGFLFDPPLGSFLVDVGVYAYYLSYAVLAAAIAYAIGNRVAIVPALIGGFLLFQGTTGLFGSVVIGFFVGYLTMAVTNLFEKVPKMISGLLPIIIYPVIITLMTLGLVYLMNQFAGDYIHIVISFLFYDHPVLVVILATLLATMMAFDLGGPINKIAYLIAIMSLADGLTSTVMAAVIAGGMVPPLVVSLIQLIKPKETDATWWVTGILGLSFMTEGAISYVEKDKKIRTSMMMIGSGIAGGIVGYFAINTRLPHGGILITLFMNEWYYFFLALGVGIFITLLLLGLVSVFKKHKKTPNKPLQV